MRQNKKILAFATQGSGGDDEDRIKIIIVGDGTGKKELEKRAADLLNKKFF